MERVEEVAKGEMDCVWRCGTIWISERVALCWRRESGWVAV